jgi:RuvB-like protein 2
MIISTKPYTEPELGAILAIRAEEEDVALSGEGMGALTRIARETSLRYAMHLLMCAALVAKQRRASEVGKEDVRRVYSLFVDIRRSTQFLLEFNSQFMFNELDTAASAESGAAAPSAGAGAGAGNSSSAGAMDTS